jgi:hypothetical protein
MTQDGLARPRSAFKEQGSSAPNRMRDFEAQIAQDLNRSGREWIKRWLEELTSSDPDPVTRCSSCGAIANLISKRPRLWNTRFGIVRYHRAYYVCPECHQKTCPLDEWLDPYASLRRMREGLVSGIDLPVDVMARAWKLGEARDLEMEAWRAISAKTSAEALIGNRAGFVD